MNSNYSALSREQLISIMDELLLSGHLIDRSGMAYLIAEYGHSGMTEIAILEWMTASPVYTSRIREALHITGDGVEDIFKAMQFDVGAPQEFMDFRYEVTDHDHGAFTLSHCGALIDVEPMGDDYVRGMCHDIEDPTFDATAAATNPQARMRPIHRPPRLPKERTPHCAWEVVIDSANDPLQIPDSAKKMFQSQAAATVLTPIDDTETGLTDYKGPLLSDLDFTEWATSALVRIADELALQHHLLALSYFWAVRERSDTETAQRLGYKQLTGIAGMTAERLSAAMGLGASAADLVSLLSVHPVFNPLAYTQLEITLEGDGVTVRFPLSSPAVADQSWLSLLGEGKVDPFNAIARAVDSRWQVVNTVTDDTDFVATFQLGAELPELPEVGIVRFSTGAKFEFTSNRKALPLIVN